MQLTIYHTLFLSPQGNTAISTILEIVIFACIKQINSCWAPVEK